MQLGRKGLNTKLLETAIQRLTKAYTLCGKSKKKEMEKEIEDQIKRAKKIKFLIERQIYNKEASEKYQECKNVIKNDKNLSENERLKLQADLDELFIFDYQELSEIPSVFICSLSTKIMTNPYITIYGNTFNY